MRISQAICAFLLSIGIPSPSTAASIFDDEEINAQLKAFDVAGIHFADTSEDVQQVLSAAGWTLVRDSQILGEPFRDMVNREASKRMGRRFVPSGVRVPYLQEYRKGAQSLEINYMQHSLGSLVYKVAYQHHGVKTPNAVSEFRTFVDDKYRRTPLVEFSRQLRCLPSDSMCRDSVRNGRVLAYYPSVRTMSLSGEWVILEGGDAAEEIFKSAVVNAIEASGPITVDF